MCRFPLLSLFRSPAPPPPDRLTPGTWSRRTRLAAAAHGHGPLPVEIETGHRGYAPPSAPHAKPCQGTFVPDSGCDACVGSSRRGTVLLNP